MRSGGRLRLCCCIGIKPSQNLRRRPLKPVLKTLRVGHHNTLRYSDEFTFLSPAGHLPTHLGSSFST